MNKDFFTKPISLKDIKISSIDFKKIKNKKEIVIGILILAYIIMILCIGNKLLTDRSEVKSQYEIKERKYNSLVNASSEEEIKNQIAVLELEKQKLSEKFIEVENYTQFNEIYNEFKSGSPISWEKEDIDLRPSTKEFSEYDIYVINISSFSTTFTQLEQFLEYVDNYDRIVRVDTLNIKRSNITGRLDGQIKLSFYFKKLAE